MRMQLFLACARLFAACARLFPGMRPAVPGMRPAAVHGMRPAVHGMRPAVPSMRPAVPGMRPAVPGMRQAVLQHAHAPGCSWHALVVRGMRLPVPGRPAVMPPAARLFTACARLRAGRCGYKRLQGLVTSVTIVIT